MALKKYVFIGNLQKNHSEQANWGKEVWFLKLLVKIIGMDPVIILSFIAGLLLVYQVFVAKDHDKLDAFGHEVYVKHKKWHLNRVIAIKT